MSHPLQATFISEGVLQVQRSVWKDICHYVSRRERGKQSIVSQMIYCLSLALRILRFEDEKLIYPGPCLKYLQNIFSLSAFADPPLTEIKA